VNSNPLSKVDPTGLFVPALALPFIGGGGLSLGGWGSAAVGAGAILTATSISGDTPNQPYVNDPQAQAEHDAYKNRSTQTPPPNLDECERLKWLLKREQDVVQAMRAWDAKWLAGRHAEAISQRTRGIDKLKEQIKKKCGDCNL
jgi:hypothetical protein